MSTIEHIWRTGDYLERSILIFFLILIGVVLPTLGYFILMVFDTETSTYLVSGLIIGLSLK